MIRIPAPHEPCTCSRTVWMLDKLSYLSESGMTNAWWRCDFCKRMVVCGYVPDSVDPLL